MQKPPLLVTGQHAKWNVHWLVKKKGRLKVVDHDCGNDLNEAIRIYTKAVEAGKPSATLRCRNVGFPPPEKYRPYEKTVRRYKRTKSGRIIRRNGKRQVDVVTVSKKPMKAVNEKGIWWCPYCREFRRFRAQAGTRYEGIYMHEPGYYCPICEISNKDHWVRHWNPKAEIMYYHEQSAPRRRRGRRHSRED